MNVYLCIAPNVILYFYSKCVKFTCKEKKILELMSCYHNELQLHANFL